MWHNYWKIYAVAYKLCEIFTDVRRWMFLFPWGIVKCDTLKKWCGRNGILHTFRETISEIPYSIRLFWTELCQVTWYIYIILMISSTFGAFIMIIVTYKFAYLSKVATRILKYIKFLKGIENRELNVNVWKTL